MDHQLSHFSQVIQEFKEMSFHADSSAFFRFNVLIDTFHLLTNRKSNSTLSSGISFPKLVSELHNLAGLVYASRREESLGYIENDPDKLKLSCFELMEHNFRENTHSNILRYLFDYHFLGNTAPVIISNLIADEQCLIPDLTSKLQKKNYSVHREVSTNSGRIDILIVDKVQQFAIVIENKVLAEVAIKENNQPGMVKTQLTNYVDYLNEQFRDFDKEFILLSFVESDRLYNPFRPKSYKHLASALEKIYMQDTILIQYRLLLQSLQNPIKDRTQRAKEAIILQNGEANLPLNNLELLNAILQWNENRPSR